MTTKTKQFDCVEMKNQIQQRLLAEYESRKAEFPTFLDFIRAKSDESEWVQQMRRKLGRRR